MCLGMVSRYGTSTALAVDFSLPAASARTAGGANRRSGKADSQSIFIEGLRKTVGTGMSLEAGPGQGLDGDDNVDGTVRLIEDVFDDKGWKSRAPEALSGHFEFAAAFAELRVDAKAGVQFREGVKHGAAV